MASPQHSITVHAPTVHVVGAGLAGLAAAAFVARSGRPVVVHEHRNRLGGRAATEERSGFRFNQGPHALYLGGEAQSTLERLGVSLAGSPPPDRGGQIVLDGRRFRLPSSTGALAATRVVGLRDKVDLGKVFARLGSIDAATLAGTTVDDWIGSVTDRPGAAAVLHAFVRLATYVNDPGDLSAEVAVLQLQRGVDTGVRYLHGGWQQLVTQLASIVVGSGGWIEPGEPVLELPDAAAVIVAAGGPAVAARLIGTAFDVGPPSDAAVLDLALSGPAPSRFALGMDRAMYLSDHGFMESMSPPGRCSVSVAQYLGPDGADDAEPDRAGLRAFADQLGIADDMVMADRYLHRMTTVSAIATASRGGLAGRPPVVVADRPGVFVAGDWVGPYGHLADASLSSAHHAAIAAIEHLDRSAVR